MEGAFRKIDVDIYDEDVLQEHELYEPDSRDPAAVLDDARAKQTSVRSALNKGDTVSALSLALSDYPFGLNVDDAKVIALQVVLSILNTTKSTDIPNVLKALTPEQHDVLMKYIYKGMASSGSDVNGNILLDWHEKLTEIAGLGCIVRTMTDRKTV
ncbi:arp2/3 complex subunit [Cylindrobasidium torrendii FP15055 ss-10]|uniref:Actin-related protein 2/3 complex subunit 5 n=1 Tax=Cylindrobasidium torrendii FP15055 ss-10 TaxID=1314674 RepID=A0A0D7BVD6_9AGAR|nr:arp2/3 complex subunit [Cylindrobasidium torrendii FP15055 ss-10]